MGERTHGGVAVAVGDGLGEGSGMTVGNGRGVGVTKGFNPAVLAAGVRLGRADCALAGDAPSASAEHTSTEQPSATARAS